MLTVKELRNLAVGLSEAVFRQQLGPFALVQKPPRPVMEQMALRLGAQRTMAVVGGPGNLEVLQVQMLLHFDELWVATLPPLRKEDTLLVGRLPSCDLVINDPSVSKEHAVVRWYAPALACAVTDLQSTNGTYVNGEPLPPGEEQVVRDADILGFGDATFVYFSSKALWLRLTTAEGPFPSR
jgi:hypothetical protein